MVILFFCGVTHYTASHFQSVLFFLHTYWTNPIFHWFFFMVFNTTLNNIPHISWWSVLLMEETGVAGENHCPAASHWQALSHNVVHLAMSGFELTTSVVIGNDCKSN